MSLDKLKDRAEQADAKALKLSGEYQDKVDQQVTKKWNELKERYGSRIEEANEEARVAQKEYADALVLQDLMDRPDGPAVAQTLVQQGGLTQEQVDEAGLSRG